MGIKDGMLFIGVQQKDAKTDDIRLGIFLALGDDR